MKAIHLVQILFVAVLYFQLALGLNQQNHKFVDKIVSRFEETVQKFESIFNIKHSKENNEDTVDPKVWAVLVAGSNGYYNYRHQVIGPLTSLFHFRVSKKYQYKCLCLVTRLMSAMLIKYYATMEYQQKIS